MAALTRNINKALVAKPAKASRARAVVMKSSNRPLWLPDTKAPPHLNGTLPGDSGTQRR